MLKISVQLNHYRLDLKNNPRVIMQTLQKNRKHKGAYLYQLQISHVKKNPCKPWKNNYLKKFCGLKKRWP